MNYCILQDFADKIITVIFASLECLLGTHRKRSGKTKESRDSKSEKVTTTLKQSHLGKGHKTSL